MIRTCLLVFAAVAALVPERAAALPRDCPRGKQWDPNQGSCVAIKRAPRRTPEQRYQEALRHIDGTARRARPDRGVALLSQNCRAGHGRSCTMLGYLHRHGRHVAKSAKDSLAFYNQGCDHKDAEGCLGAAQVNADGLLGAPDQREAKRLFARACDLDSGKGCFELAEKHAKALGTAEDRERAAALYERSRRLLEPACAGSATDCYYLGRIFAGGLGVARDPKRALDAYIRGCAGGSGDACREVGNAYQHGLGTTADQLEARTYFDRGCHRYDNADSCNRVGWMMVGWSDSARDDKAVRDYAVRACDLDKRHCALRAYTHGLGIGVPEDPRASSQYYLLACDNGHAQSCYVAGNRSQAGNGVPENQSRAVELWKKACELSWADACQKLGSAYKDGRGVAASQPEAYRHYHLACIRRSGAACLDAGRMVAAGEHGKRASIPTAITYYKYGCSDLEHGASCVALADLYLAGDKVKADPARASALLETGCKLGHAGACRDLGHYRFVGQHGETDKLAAARLFARSCLHGDPKPCWWIDRALAEGNAQPADKKTALDTLETACRQRERDQACQVLGRLYAYGGTMSAKRPRDAVALFQARCQAGDSRGCYELGWLYAAGVGVVKNIDKASDIFSAECDKNTPGACVALAIQMWEKKKYKPATALMSKACEEGDPSGCTYEAFAHYTAKGVRWNVREAAELWKKGCALDLPLACANVGELLWHGIAVKKDREAAFAHYQKGCTPTEPAGCTWVGRGYHLGEHVERDLDRAEREYKRMCNSEAWGSAEACLFLAELYAETGKASASVIAALRQQAFDMAVENAEGNPYGHYVLGKLHAAGVATVKDPKKALEHFVAACDGYDPLGCVHAGELLLAGDGVAADRPRAAIYLDRACAAGLEPSCARAKQARQPTAPEDRKRPAGPKKASSCAGCHSGGETGGALVIIVAALALAWRRRDQRITTSESPSSASG